MTFTTRDASPPLVPIAAGGVDVAGSTEVELVAASAGRIKVTVCHSGDDGTAWLGLGQTAATNTGLYLTPGDVFEEFYAGAVRVRNTDTSPQRMTWVEWGAE